MEINKYIKVVLASLLLMAGLTLSSVWYHYYGTQATFTHPWVQNSSGDVFPMTYKLHLFYTQLWSVAMVLIVAVSKSLSPKMVFGKIGDLWVYYYVYMAGNLIDFILTYRTSNYRIYTTILFIVVQSAYLVWLFRRVDLSK